MLNNEHLGWKMESMDKFNYYRFQLDLITMGSNFTGYIEGQFITITNETWINQEKGDQ